MGQRRLGGCQLGIERGPQRIAKIVKELSVHEQAEIVVQGKGLAGVGFVIPAGWHCVQCSHEMRRDVGVLPGSLPRGHASSLLEPMVGCTQRVSDGDIRAKDVVLVIVPHRARSQAIVGRS